MKYLNVPKDSINMDYYDHLNNGEYYTCDKCDIVKLNSHEYNNYIQFQFHYCELCWNYIHLKKGICQDCKTTMTSRNEYPDIKVSCSCGRQVLLEIEA